MRWISLMSAAASSVIATVGCMGAEYDLYVAGGTIEAVKLAVAAANEGKKVFLAAPRPYLGEDRAATLDLLRHPDDDMADPILRDMFNARHGAERAYESFAKRKGWKSAELMRETEDEKVCQTGIADFTTPLLIKRACDNAMLRAKAKYLTGAQTVAARKTGSEWLITYVCRSGERKISAREFFDRRYPRSIKRGKHEFVYRVVRGVDRGKIEEMRFTYEVKRDGALGMVDVENYVRGLVDTEKLLDTAEWVVCQDCERATVPSDVVPITLGECDVFVAGGGTGGGPAGVAAARNGARVIVAEYMNTLGGVSTEGRICGYNAYYDGNVTGYTKEFESGSRRLGGEAIFSKSEWVRRAITKCGGDVWLGTAVCGAITENNCLTGAIVVLPDGTRGIVKCKVAVDATGNSDLAAAAGVETEFINADGLSLQGCGMAPQPFGKGTVNSDIGFVDDTDAEDLWYFALRSRLSMTDKIWNQSSLVDSRERRRIIGEFRITPIDLMLNRTYPDTICNAMSAFDTHGETTHDVFFIRGTGKRGDRIRGNIPYRALLPAKIDGVISTGLGISAHRDAMPPLRMKADIQNQGYAAGLAAAMAANDGVVPRKIDVRELQKKLVAIGNLKAAVLTEEDSLPVSDEVMAAAAKDTVNGFDQVAVLLSDPKRAIKYLRREENINAVQIRGQLGDETAASALIGKLQDAEWGEGWNYRGMSQYEKCVGQTDRYVIALGNTRRREAIGVLNRLAAKLTGKSEYSHFRVLAMAYVKIGERTCAGVLAGLLRMPTVSGHSLKPDEVPPIPGYSDEASNKERSDVLRELCMAAALYRLGDCEGLGLRILKGYANDPRRAFANYAKLVLK